MVKEIGDNAMRIGAHKFTITSILREQTPKAFRRGSEVFQLWTWTERRSCRQVWWSPRGFIIVYTEATEPKALETQGEWFYRDRGLLLYALA